MATIKNTGVLLDSGCPMQVYTRERRRNNLGLGSFTIAKHETTVRLPSALQEICQNRQSKKKAL